MPILRAPANIRPPITSKPFTSLRFDKATVNNGTTFRDILAPGAYVTFGVTHDWPLTFGVGYQYSQGQRKDASTGEALPASRYLVFMAIDIPYSGHP